MRTFYRVFIFLFFTQNYAQVGINTTTPEAQLEVKASNEATPSNKDGLLVPRVNAFPATNPTAAQQGMLVYLMVTVGSHTPGFYYWDNLTTSWVGISSTANGDKDWFKVGTTAAPTAITDDMFHTGKVGIGNANPFTNLHVTSNSTGMTPNTESIAVFENTTNTFLNVLSNLESGVLFGANGNATNGGIVYNPTSLPNSMLFRTNGNVNRMVISNDGNIGLGSFIPTLPLQFPPLLGDKVAFYGGAGPHYGIGIQHQLLQIHADLLNSDIAFGYGSSSALTERMRIKGTGNVGIGTSAPASRLHIQNGTSGMTPNPNSLHTVEGSGNNVYANLLSAQETGVLFGSSGQSANGGIIYNAGYSGPEGPNTMSFRTGGNVNRMIIGSTGKVALGNFIPSVQLEFDNVLGEKICLFGQTGNMYGFGIQSSLLQMYTPGIVNDIAFGYGTTDALVERMRIKGTGNVGIGTSTPSSRLHVQNGSSGITANGSSVHTVEGSGTNVYTNLLSTQETGVLFGSNGVSNNGGLIYNPAAYPNSMLFRTGGNANRMIVTDTGNVGIGNFAPTSKLHVYNGASGIIANGSAIITAETNVANAYMNVLSTQETGVLFGASGASNNGGLIYNAPAYPNSMLFRTGGNTNRMVIGSTGNVAIGNFTPDYPLHFPATTGDKISLFGGTGPHYGFGIQGSLLQIHSGTSADDIAFGFGSSAAFTERMRVKGTGEVGIGTSTPTAELEVNGFTKMGGSTAPAVKMIKLTGTTSNTQGGFVQVVHGLTSSKILSVSVLVEYSAGNSVPPSYSGSAGYEYDYYISPTSVVVWNKAANSVNILSRPIRVLVTYEE